MKTITTKIDPTLEGEAAADQLGTNICNLISEHDATFETVFSVQLTILAGELQTTVCEGCRKAMVETVREMLKRVDPDTDGEVRHLH